MSNESLLKTGLIATVFLALVAYHVMAIFVPADSNLFSLYKIAQLAVVFAFIAFAVSTQFVPKLISTSGYIGGIYTGKSTDFQIEPAPKNAPAIDPPHFETFKIKQTLFETTIEGTSKREGEDIDYSSWVGRRFHVHGHTHYFGIMILTPNAIESGTLTLTIKDDGGVTGLYFSGDPDSTKRCRLTAQIKSRVPTERST